MFEAMRSGAVGDGNGSRNRWPRTSHGWVLLAGITLAASGVPACALVAGLEEHALDPTGTGGTQSTAVTTTTTGASGGGGSGGVGGSASSRAWPDSPTARCTNGLADVACPTATAHPTHGQDGDVRINVPVYATTDDLVTDPLTQLTWRRAPLSPRTWTLARDFCSMQPFKGFDDWRLPSRIELLSVIDHGAVGARIDHAAFPGVAAAPLWTSTRFHGTGGVPSSVWGIDLGCSLSCQPDQNGGGNLYSMYDGNDHAALCVRGAPYATGDFEAPSLGTVRDRSTGLVWQVGVDPGGGTTWTGALHVCRDVMNGEQFGDATDWRLPTLKELHTIIDDSAPKNPATYAVFEGGMADYLWTSTPVTEIVGPPHAYTVLLTDGSSSSLPLTANYAKVRCVHGP